MEEEGENRDKGESLEETGVGSNKDEISAKGKLISKRDRGEWRRVARE